MALDFSNSSQQFLASLDAEIERLQAVRSQVAAALGAETMPKTRPVGRPKRRGMSEEGRRRVAAAQKLRWANQKKAAKSAAKAAAAKPSSTKTTAAKRASPKKAAAVKTAEPA